MRTRKKTTPTTVPVEKSRKARAARSLGAAGENGIVKRAQAKDIPAKKQPGSGIYKGYRSDVVLAVRFLVESKVRSAKIDAKERKTLSLDFGWLAKVTREAAADGFDHALLVERVKGSSEPLVVVTLEHYLTLLAVAQNKPIPRTADPSVFDLGNRTE